MVEGSKPTTAGGYYPDVTEACERTLLTLLSAFGGLKTTLRLVGGLVPRYLTPEAPPNVPAHAGTSDVDVVLNLQVIAEGDGYATLANQLTARGFKRLRKEGGKVSSWQWERRVTEHLSVVTEFLHDAGDNQAGQVMPIDGERVSALSVQFAGIVHDWFDEREISAELLDGKGLVTDTIRFADVPAFVILKALALADRHENKDAADLVHVLRYAGTIDNVADQFVQHERSGTHPGAVEAGLDALRRCFCDDERGEGYRKVGAVGYGLFHDTGDEDARVRAQRDASGLVQALLETINSRLDDLKAK
jgi:hypothetical protein